METKMERYDERPWGRWDLLDEEEGFKVKKITVKPNQRLSLQLHHHRAENWVVAKGKARVRVGDRIMEVEERETVFIPKETEHRLENIGEDDLIVIEVQTGEYLREDDLVRIEDDYGRIER
jgi:mannose-1-phosphate guanylyltransferase/mannose-6-phosphate isomerase